MNCYRASALFFLTLFSANTLANIGDFFGASTSSIAIAGQSTFDPTDAANAFYAPALLADDSSTTYSYSEIILQTDFKDIDNIVKTSPINSSESSDLYGDINMSTSTKFYRSFHGSFKLFKSIKSKLNISLFLPSETFLEIKTGDPYRPEYVMYSRFDRTIGYLSYAQKLKHFNFSIGFMSGVQSNGETFIVAQDNGSTTPSSGKMQFNAKPSAALNFSLSKKWKYGTSFFSFQDEMKSKLENSASGVTPIGGGTLPYAWDMSSMLFYDPSTYRLSHRYKNLITTIEYQDWSGYETPILRLDATDSSVLISSKPVENFTTRSIIIPKVGYLLSDFSFGLSYRQSPLKLKNGASGNTIDTSSTIASIGYKRSFKFLSQEFRFDSAFTYHYLQNQTITKDPNRENGSAGNKIGYPEYEVGGNVYALSIGLSWVL